MAEENVIQTNIVATSNMSSLIADLNKVSTALSGLQEKLSATNKGLATQIAVMNRTFSETLRSTGQFSTHFVSLASDVDKFGSQLDKGQLKLNQFFRVYSQHAKTSGGLIRDLAKQQVQLQNAILQPLGRNAEGLMQYNVQIPRGLDLVKNKTAIANQELRIMNKVVQEGANQLINWGKNTQWAGRQLTVGLTVPMAAFGKAAADAFKQADEQLVRLTKVYGGIAPTTQQELAKVRKDVAATAAELAKAYGTSYTETIALAADIAATGKQGNELLQSTRETTRLAVLGEVDKQEAMKATLAIQSAFKENTDDLAKSINFLNAVENQTSTSLADLIEAIPKAGPVVKSLGGSVQDLALYLTAMREGGISASEGANAIKSSLASLINPTKVATAMFADFGIDLKGIVQKNAGNLTETLLTLQAALDNLNPLQKQQAIEQLFGKFQFARLNALFSNLGRQGSQTLQVLDLMKASSEDLANIAGRELGQITESASGKYRRAIEGLKADLAGVGDQFLTIGTTLINLIDKVVKFMDKLPKPVKSALAFIGMLTATAGPLIMLTGVLGNFFGYIIKGVSHFKALFKGAEGWKLLTPEILAANKAGDLAEQTFYSDAKAAAILKQAIDGLSASYMNLATKAEAGVIGINGTLTAAAAQAYTMTREVNPLSPYISAKDTRSMSHLNPVAGMTADQKQAQTMFGVVPGAPTVNNIIGKNPQMYMTSDLEKIPGVSAVKDVSTGIVAQEAAKWHSMTAALAMQSEAEIAKLKTEIAQTGLITDGVQEAYAALLPKMNEITANAANASAAIVQELKENKISADVARARIIELNAQIETMMVQAATSTATSLGRNIDVTKVPLLNQPVVNQTTGKSNMKELLKPGRTRGLLNKIAGVLGVKTYGAGYSIETTRPKKFNLGGSVYLNDGQFVPGPNVNKDVVPAMLTPGEFVLRRSVAQSDPEGVKALNEGQAYIVPIQHRFAGGPILNLLTRLAGWNRARVGSARRVYETGANPSTRRLLEDNNFGPDPYSSMERRTSSFWTPLLNPGQRKPGEVLAHVITSKYLRRFKNFGMQGSVPIASGSQLERKLGISPSGNSANKMYQILPDNVINVAEDFNKALARGNATGSMWLSSNRQPQHLISLMSHLLNAGVPYKVAYRVASRTLSRIDKAMLNLKDTKLSETKWGNIVDNAMAMEVESIQKSYQVASQFGFNRGGEVPGYVLGGRIKIPSWVIRNEKVRSLSNTDPLHGPLQIGRYQPPLTVRTRRVGAGIQYRGNYTPFTWERGPRAGETSWSPRRTSKVPAFLTGSLEERGRYVTEEYMRGNYEVLSIPGAQEAMKAWSQKTSGIFHRGITLNGWSKVGGQMPPLPKWLMEELNLARATGDYSKLIGKDFIMRRSSWSSNPETAKGFGDFQLVADVQNRRVTPASQMFPELDFYTPGSKVKVNESESIFGGKFRIVNAGPDGLQLKTVGGPFGGKRAMGGPVNAGMPYLVGENGPEMFVPRNSGGIIPHYALGGKVLAGATVAGLVAQMFGTQIGGAIGKQVGGEKGQAVGSSVGTGVGVAAMLASLATMFVGVGKGAEEAEGKVGKFGKAMSAVKGAISALPIQAKIAIVAVTAIATGLMAWKKHADAVAKTNRLAFAGAVQPLNTFDEKLKAVRQGLADVSAKQKDLVASNTGAGIPGVAMTVKEFEKLKDSVKTAYPEIIKLFNQTDNGKLADTAAGIKIQLMAAGDSAEKAQAKVAALLSMSNKSSQTTRIMLSQQVQAIKDLDSASGASLKYLSVAQSRGGTKDFAGSLLSSFQTLDKAFEASASKNGPLKAMQEQFEKIANSQSKNLKLTQDQINEIAKTNPLLAASLSTSDKIGDAYAKWRIQLAGVNKDLTGLNSGQLKDIAEYVTQINSIFGKYADTSSTEAQSGPLGSLAKTINAYNVKQKAMETASQNGYAKTTASIKEQIKLKDKQIKQIQDEADARKKALQAQTNAEDLKLQIQQEQLKYQDALASGNMSAAAMAQLTIKRLVGQSTAANAQTAIDDKAKKDIEKLQAEKDALNDQADTISSKPTYKAKESPLAAIYADLNTLLQTIERDRPGKPTAEDKKTFDALMTQLRKISPTEANKINPLGSGTYSYAPGPSDISGGKVNIPQGGIKSGTDFNTLLTSTDKAVTSKIATNTGITNDKLEAIKNILAGRKDIGSGSGTKSDPFVIGNIKTSAKGRTGQLFASSTTDKNGDLTEVGKQEVIISNKLQAGSFFTYNGKTYQVKYGYDNKWKPREWESDAVVVKKAQGGLIKGPGTETSDSIFMPMLPRGKYASGAYVSTGEYVVRAAAVKRPGMLSLLDQINNSKINVPTMGGYNVGSSSSTSGGTVQNIYNTSFYVTEAVDLDDAMRKWDEHIGLKNARIGTNKDLKLDAMRTAK
jgi:TP901 family phage tail tape measure protein